MLNLVIFGPPGAGKGTQSELLIEKYDLKHISTGDLFRWHTKNNTELGERVKEIMNSGNLVPDEITIAMLKEEVERHPEVSGFLFDGFPRTVAQAESLDRLMISMNTAVHGVVQLEVSEEVVRERIAKRKTLENRPDDQEEKLNKRISEYFNKTVHVLPYYKEQGRLKTVDGIGIIEEIFEEICSVTENFMAAKP